MIDKHNLKEKAKLKNEPWEVLRLHILQHPPFPCEMFYKPNVASVCAAEDVYSSLYLVPYQITGFIL